jgi:membrane fusion protein, multidrug efflux system
LLRAIESGLCGYMRVKVVLMVVAFLLGAGAAIHVWNLGGWSPGDWVDRGQAATSKGDPRAPLSPGLRPSQENPTDVKPAVPVVAATVHQGDVPIYLSGLGTVQAYYAVDMKAQVDGVILKMPFEEGQDVKVADPIVIIDPQTYEARLDHAQAQKARATAQLENAKTQLLRDEELLKQNVSTQKQTDQQRMLVGQYTAEIAQYEADIKYAQAQLSYATIRSPVNGRIGIRKVDPGNLVRAADNATLVTIVQLQPISVIITVPAKELAQNDISLGLTNLSVIAYAENGITPLGRGQVQTVDNTVNQTTGTIKLKASFDNEQYKLWPGDFVDCKIIVQRRRDGLTVPTAAVRHGPRGDFVWVIQPDSTVAIRPVRVRQTVGGTAVIDFGLDAKEKVVIDGYTRLLPGSRVAITSPKSEPDSRILSSTE